ncbi:MAG: amidohydrolase [Armatimonadetes bacterium]|nr:amidohydrolase [Armatimonadota bacterium]
MIVDCHTHIWQCPEHVGGAFAADAARVWGARAPLNLTPEAHQTAMAAVDRAIVFGLRARHVGILVPNDCVADLVRRDPAKYIGFLSVDPLVDDVPAEVERGVQELGLRGIKLGPTYGAYHPMDERLQPAYAFAGKHGLPVLFHQGATFVRTAPLKYANPVLLEDVALRYPDLKIVIAHLGHPWDAETIVLLRKQPTVSAGISALFFRPWQLYNAMRLAIEYAVIDKLLFGTDYPFSTVEASIEGFRRVSEIGHGTSLPRVPWSVFAAILHRDSLALLGLE